MAIQDSDPERRNLNITSLAFIIYFYAGGSFPDSNVRLQVINAEFSRPEVLSTIVWIMFIWFIYRYWLAHSGNFYSEFKNEFLEWHNKEYIKEYVSNSIGKELASDTEEGYHTVDIGWQDWHVIVNSVYAKKITRNSEGKVQSYSGAANQEKIEFIGFLGWVLASRATIECFAKYPSFSNYLVPYILVFLAFFGALVHYMS